MFCDLQGYLVGSNSNIFCWTRSLAAGYPRWAPNSLCLLSAEITGIAAHYPSQVAVSLSGFHTTEQCSSEDVLHTLLLFSRVGLFPLRRPSACPSWSSTDKPSQGSASLAVGLTCCFLFPQGSLSLLLPAHWSFRLLPHIFCLEIFVCFATAAKRVNLIFVNYILVTVRSTSPQTLFWSQKKNKAGTVALPWV